MAKYTGAIYETVSPPIECMFFNPYAKERMKGFITARTKERVPEWYKIQTPSYATCAYSAKVCDITFDTPLHDKGLEYGDRVEAPVRTSLPSFDDCKETNTAVEFFAGCGRLSDAIEKHTSLDHSTRIDFSTMFSPDCKSIRKDIGALRKKQLEKLMSAKYIHMSPTCSTYSQLASSYHKRNFKSNYLGVTHEAYAANGLLLRLFKALRKRQTASHMKKAIVTIENPDATFHLTPIGMKMQAPLDEGGLGLTLLRFSFCAFNEKWRKKSILLTNSPSLIAKLASDSHVCTSRVCRFHNCAHTPITKRCKNGGVDTDKVTPFPTALCDEIAKAVECDM